MNNINQIKEHYPMTSWEPTPESQDIYKDNFKDLPVYSFGSKFTYSTAHDFGKIIRKLLISKPDEGCDKRFSKNMREIAEIEGFEVCTVKESYYPRDPVLKLHNSKIVDSKFLPSHQNIIDKLKARAQIFKDHPFALSDDEFFNGTLGTVGSHQDVRKTGHDFPIKKNVRIYLEGGNCYCLTNKHQVLQWIIGEDLAYATHHCLSAEKWFDPIDKWNQSFWNEEKCYAKKNDQLYQLFIQGKIPQKIEEMAVPISQSLTLKEIEQIVKEKKFMDLFFPKELSPLDPKDSCEKQIASRYRAQLEFIKHEMFPCELEIPEGQVNFILQPAYHIDLGIAPWYEGSLLLQDHSLSLRVLQIIKKNAQELNLDELDIKQLNSFLETTEKMSRSLSSLMKQIQNQVEQAGFTAILTPGAFFGSRKKTINAPLKSSNINFLNSISGFSTKQQHFYYITSGAEGRLGQILMDIFTLFLNHHSPEQTAVYFTGRKRSTPNDFSEAEKALNKFACGPHCLSFELETEPNSNNS